VFGALVGATVGSGKTTDKLAQESVGTWTECPAFVIGGKYALSVGNTSDAHLEGASGGKPFKLDFLSSAALPVPSARPPSPSGQSEAPNTGATKVHITSSPSGGDIYVDGQFVGNAPSDIVLSAGEHVVKVTLGSKEWARTVQITGGEIQLRAEIP
jgi:hypothetical protein